MDKYEHRRQRLIDLLDDPSFGSKGKQAELSRRTGIDASYISRLLYPEGKKGRKRMAEDTIEVLEKGCGLPKGWFDLPLGVYSNTDIAETRTKNTGYINLSLLNVEAAAGNGRNGLEFPEVVQHIDVLESWARTALGGDLSRIKLITAHGTSMQGTIENGDVLFVDANVRSYDGDGIYVITRGGDVQVKRLQKLHGDVLAIISDNKAYESERLTGEEANSVIVCGRVLAAWSLHKFW